MCIFPKIELISQLVELFYFIYIFRYFCIKKKYVLRKNVKVQLLSLLLENDFSGYKINSKYNLIFCIIPNCMY